jgi:hypothetical protein
MNWYRLSADLILIVHAAFVGFVLFGLIVVWVGVARGWPWVRSLWFRGLHLAAIGFVVLQSYAHIVCPLTELENALRRHGGQVPYGPRGCVEYWLHRMIFYSAPPWVFITCYTLFGLAVAATFIWVPPRWPRRAATPPPAIPNEAPV